MRTPLRGRVRPFAGVGQRGPGGGLLTDPAGNVQVLPIADFRTAMGAGDVVGPSSATDNAVARFDGTTGKLLQSSAPIVQDDGRISTVTDPTGAQDAATKAYVDALAVNLGKRARVRAASTADLTIATALNNGDVLDGVTLVTGDLVLVKDQATTSQNGVYVVGVTPARDAQFDTYDEHPGSLLAVEEGTANADTLWLCTSNVGGTIAVTAIVFSQLSVTAGITQLTGDGTAGPGSGSQVLTIATLVGDSGAGGTKGLAPAPAAGDATAGKFLKASGAWAVPSGTGAAIQTVNALYVTKTTGTTTIPADDTIPQNTEGDQYFTATITPTAAANKLLIELVVFAAHSTANQWMVAALFQDSTANALAVGATFETTAGQIIPIRVAYYMTAGTTSATTFKVRVGSANGGTTTVNGSSGSRLYGGVLTSSLTITEVIP